MLPSISDWSAGPDAPPRLKVWFCWGLVLGLLVSSLFSWRWIEAGFGTQVSVLGSGRYVSVLISHNLRRVLIVSGNDGPAFSNTLSATLPPIGSSIDVLLIDPRSSADVIERAHSLSAKRVMILPDEQNVHDPNSVQRSFVIDMGDGISISIRILPERTWAATVEHGAGRILITPRAGQTSPASIHVSLDGSVADSSDGQAAIEIGPTAKGLPLTTPRAVVGSGDILTITVDKSGLRLPRGTVASA